MGLQSRWVKLLLLLVLACTPASAFTEYSHLLPDREVNLLQLLVIPQSCNEFIPENALQNETVSAGVHSSASYSFLVQAQTSLERARQVALLQQLYWATPSTHSLYLTTSYWCHQHAMAALYSSVNASRLYLAQMERQLQLLEFEAGEIAPKNLLAESVLAHSRKEKLAFAGGASSGGDAPIAQVFFSVAAKTSHALASALTSNTGAATAIAENFRLVEAISQFNREIALAREQLATRLLERQRDFSISQAVAKTRIEFVRQEQLEQVADEWFAYLPSGKIAVSGSEPSFRETVRSALANFDEANAFAQEGSKVIELHKQGWQGTAYQLYAQASQKMQASVLSAQIAQERSLELEQDLSADVVSQTSELNKKAAEVSAANPFGASYAYSVARQVSLSYEELAGAARGKKIREFVVLLRQLRQAMEVAGQNPSFNWALEVLKEQAGQARRLLESAKKDGLEASFYQRQLQQAEDALLQLQQSQSEDLELAAALSENLLQLTSGLEKEVGEKFVPLPEKLALLNQLKHFLSEAERKQLELYSQQYFESATQEEYLKESGGELGQTQEWLDEKLAELSAKSAEIASAHLQQNAFATEVMQAAPLGLQAEGELTWRAEHALPLETDALFTITLPQLESASEIRLNDRSSGVLSVSGNKLVIAGSKQGQGHYATVSFRKIVTSKESEKTSSTASAELHTLRTQVEFTAKQAATVLFEKKVSAKTSVLIESTNTAESAVSETPRGKTYFFSVHAREGRNELTIVEQTPYPISVNRSVFYNQAIGKLEVTYEIVNLLEQEISGLQVDLQENIVCLQGKTTVKSNAAQSIQQQRSGQILATRLIGMRLAPLEKQSALLEVECNSVSQYASAKLAELSEHPQVPIRAAKELTEAQAALFSGNFALAAELSAEIEDKISAVEREGNLFAQEKLSLVIEAKEIESLANELENASLHAVEKEFEASAGKAISSAKKALSLLGQIGVNGIELTESEQKRRVGIVAQARTEIAAASEELSRSTGLLGEQVSSLIRECSKPAASSSKAVACAGTKEIAWKAKEKLLLGKPGAALQLLANAKKTLQDFNDAREKRLAENTDSRELLRAALLNARSALEKSEKAFANSEVSGALAKTPQLQLAVSARKSLEVELPKSMKTLAVLDSGEQERLFEMPPSSVRERKDLLVNATAKLEHSLGEVELLARTTVEAAQQRSNELGDQKTAQKVSQAKANLQQGSLISAFALATSVNDQLKRQGAKQGGFGTREAVLTASGIAILILLAFVFTRRGDAAAEDASQAPTQGENELLEIGKQVSQAPLPTQSNAATANAEGNSEKEGKKRPSYF